MQGAMHSKAPPLFGAPSSSSSASASTSTPSSSNLDAISPTSHHDAKGAIPLAHVDDPPPILPSTFLPSYYPETRNNDLLPSYSTPPSGNLHLGPDVGPSNHLAPMGVAGRHLLDDVPLPSMTGGTWQRSSLYAETHSQGYHHGSNAMGQVPEPNAGPSRPHRNERDHWKHQYSPYPAMSNLASSSSMFPAYPRYGTGFGDDPGESGGDRVFSNSAGPMGVVDGSGEPDSGSSRAYGNGYGERRQTISSLSGPRPLERDVPPRSYSLDVGVADEGQGPKSAGYPGSMLNVMLPDGVAWDAKDLRGEDYLQAMAIYDHLHASIPYLRPSSSGSNKDSPSDHVQALINYAADGVTILTGHTPSTNSQYNIAAPGYPLVPSSTLTPGVQPGYPTVPGTHPGYASGQGYVPGSIPPPITGGTGKKGGGKDHNKGQTKCLGCGATETPEWRRGPMGPRTLCNACGLVHMKLQRKRRKMEEQAASGMKKDR